MPPASDRELLDRRAQLQRLRNVQLALTQPGVTHTDVVARFSIYQISNLFNAEGRLLLSKLGDKLAPCPIDGEAVFTQHGRAIGKNQLPSVVFALRTHAQAVQDLEPGAPRPTPREAAQAAGLSEPVINYLFDPAGHVNQDNVDALPPGEREEIHAALLNQPSATSAARWMAVHKSMLETQKSRSTLAREFNVASSTLAHFSFDRNGHFGALLITKDGNGLLNPQLATDPVALRYFEGLQRALRPIDLGRLAEVLQSASDGQTPAQAAQAADVPEPVVEYLFDKATGQVRPEQLARLPEAQQAVLRGEQRESRAGQMAVAHRMLTNSTMNRSEIAAQLGLSRAVLKKAFSADGQRLRVTDEGNALLSKRGVPNLKDRTYFEALLRELPPTDVGRLETVFIDRAGRAQSEPQTPLQAAKAGKVSQAVLSYLFDRSSGELREQSLAALPDDQQRRLRAALEGRVAEPQAAAPTAGTSEPPRARPPTGARPPRAARPAAERFPRMPALSPERDQPQRPALEGRVVTAVLQELHSRGKLTSLDYKAVAREHGLSEKDMGHVLARGGYDPSSLPASIKPPEEIWQRTVQESRAARSQAPAQTQTQTRRVRQRIEAPAAEQAPLPAALPATQSSGGWGAHRTHTPRMGPGMNAPQHPAALSPPRAAAAQPAGLADPGTPGADELAFTASSPGHGDDLSNESLLDLLMHSLTAEPGSSSAAAHSPQREADWFSAVPPFDGSPVRSVDSLPPLDDPDESFR